MRIVFSITIAMVLAFAGCGKKTDDENSGGKTTEPGPTGTPTDQPDKPKVELPDPPPVPDAPKGLPETPSPEDNPTTPEKVELGWMLFFDKRISDGGEFSCETCHVPEKGWADGEKLSRKANDQMNTRHSPTLVNVAYLADWYWDGREATLESQILAAWTGQVGATPDKVAEKLAAIPEYQARFERAFDGKAPDKENVVQALAAFVRTIRSGGSAWDDWESGEEDAVSDAAKAGFKVFSEKAQCALCHIPPLYMDTLYHNVGVGYGGEKEPDVGRFKVTNDEKDTGAFKTPGLRGVVSHPPYFHDGSVANLEQALDFMLGGGTRKGNKHIDEKLKPVKLTAQERTQLLEFIKTLSPEPAEYERPALP